MNETVLPYTDVAMDISNGLILGFSYFGLIVSTLLGFLTTHGVFNHRRFRYSRQVLSITKNGSKGLTLLLCQCATTWGAVLFYIGSILVCEFYQEKSIPVTPTQIGNCVFAARFGAFSYIIVNYFTYLFLYARIRFFLDSTEKIVGEGNKFIGRMRPVVMLLLVTTLTVPCIAVIVAWAYTGEWRSGGDRTGCMVFDRTGSLISVILTFADSFLSFGYLFVFLLFMRFATKQAFSSGVSSSKSKSFKRTARLNAFVGGVTVLITFITLVGMAVSHVFFRGERLFLASYYMSGMIPVDCFTKCLMPFVISNVWLPKWIKDFSMPGKPCANRKKKFAIASTRMFVGSNTTNESV